MTANRPVALLILFLLPAISCAGPDINNDLKKIMQDLRSDSALIVDGLLVDDYAAIADAADRIASHPRIPPAQVALVAAELGAEMAKFKQLDTLVHDLSLSISAAAQKGDTSTIADHYQRMLDGCLACHASYRQRISAVLIPQPN